MQQDGHQKIILSRTHDMARTRTPVPTIAKYMTGHSHSHTAVQFVHMNKLCADTVKTFQKNLAAIKGGHFFQRYFRLFSNLLLAATFATLISYYCQRNPVYTFHCLPHSKSIPKQLALLKQI